MTPNQVPEIANRKVWILASDEVLEELRHGRSRPVQLSATPNPDGSWDMTIYAFYNKDGTPADPSWAHRVIAMMKPEDTAL